jgi:hypothetical protein
MAKRVQRYRVSSTVMAGIIGPVGELIVNLTNNSLHVHDGVLAGGYELGRADGNNMNLATSVQNGLMTTTQVNQLAANTVDIAANTANIATILTDKMDIIAAPTVNRAVAVAAGGQLAQQTPSFGGTYTANAFVDAFDGVASLPGNPTHLLAVMATAPLGWVISTTHNDKALRIVSSAPSSGGTNSFSSRFTSQFQVTGHVLTLAEMPAHSHGVTGAYQLAHNTTTITVSSPDGLVTPWGFTSKTFSSQGSGSAHSHGVTHAVQYVDVVDIIKS